MNEKYCVDLAGESDVDEDEEDEEKEFSVEEEDDDEEGKDETDVREILKRLKDSMSDIPEFEIMTSQCGRDGDLWISEALLLLQQHLHPDVSIQSLFVHYFRQYLAGTIDY